MLIYLPVRNHLKFTQKFGHLMNLFPRFIDNCPKGIDDNFTQLQTVIPSISEHVIG